MGNKLTVPGGPTGLVRIRIMPPRLGSEAKVASFFALTDDERSNYSAPRLAELVSKTNS